MFVEAEIEGRVAPQVAVLPRAALRGRNQVLVVDEHDRIRFREIEILRSTTQSIVVSAGLAAGERVNVSPIDAATEGMSVQVVGDEQGS
jgi:hypothetical protein